MVVGQEDDDDAGGIPMYPESERIKVSDYLFIHNRSRRNNGYQPIFNVGVQYFDIGIPMDTEEEARWVLKIFDLALRNICSDK